MISISDVTGRHFPASSPGDILQQENANFKDSSVKTCPAAEGKITNYVLTSFILIMRHFIV